MKPKLCDECELRVGDKFILKEDVLKILAEEIKNLGKMSASQVYYRITQRIEDLKGECELVTLLDIKIDKNIKQKNCFFQNFNCLFSYLPATPIPKDMNPTTKKVSQLGFPIRDIKTAPAPMIAANPVPMAVILIPIVTTHFVAVVRATFRGLVYLTKKLNLYIQSKQILFWRIRVFTFSCVRLVFGQIRVSSPTVYPTPLNIIYIFQNINNLPISKDSGLPLFFRVGVI